MQEDRYTHTGTEGDEQQIVLGYAVINAETPDTDTDLLHRVATSLRELP